MVIVGAHAGEEKLMDLVSRFQNRIFLPILALFLAMPLSSCETLKDASAGEIARTFFWELPLVFLQGNVQVDGKWIDPRLGTEITIDQVNPSLGQSELTITGYGGGTQKGYANLKALKDGHVTVGTSKVGTLSKDKKRIDWEDGSFWIRPFLDLPNISKDMGFDNVIIYKYIANVSGPKACRKACLEQPGQMCGAFLFDFNARERPSSTTKACQLIEASPLAARRKEPKKGSYAGRINENLSALGAGGTFVLRSHLSGHLLEVGSSGAEIYQKKMGTIASEAQKWIFKLDDLDTYTIQHFATKKYLMAERISKEKGSGSGRIWLANTPEKEATRFSLRQKVTDAELKPISISLREEGEFNADVLGLSFGGGKTAFAEGPKNGPGVSLSRVYGGDPFQDTNNWEVIPADSLGLYPEHDITIDLLNQGAFSVDFELHYTDGFDYSDTPKAMFKDVPEMNVTGFIMNQAREHAIGIIPEIPEASLKNVPTVSLASGVCSEVQDQTTNVGVCDGFDDAIEFLDETAGEVYDFVMPDELEYVVDDGIRAVGGILDDAREGIESIFEVFEEEADLDTTPRSFTVPARARDVRVDVKYAALAGTSKSRAGSIYFDDLSRQNYCVNIEGNFADKQSVNVNTDCSRWGSDTIKAFNRTDEIIYVMWTDEVNWSSSNIGTGVITGLLLSNAQNANASFYRYFAIANAWGVELPDNAYQYFQAYSLCAKPNETRLVLSYSVFDMAENIMAIREVAKDRAEKSKKKKNDGKESKDAKKDSKTETEEEERASDNPANHDFFVDWAKDTKEQSDEYKTTYRQYNPILAIADYAGADTKTIMAVNQDLTKMWIVDSGVDDNWIINDDGIYLASKDDISKPARNGVSTDVISLNVKTNTKRDPGKCFTQKVTIPDLVETAQ